MLGGRRGVLGLCQRRHFAWCLASVEPGDEKAVTSSSRQLIDRAFQYRRSGSPGRTPAVALAMSHPARSSLAPFRNTHQAGVSASATSDAATVIAMVTFT